LAVRLLIDRGNSRTKVLSLPDAFRGKPVSLEALERAEVCHLPAIPTRSDWASIWPTTPVDSIWIGDSQAAPHDAPEWAFLQEQAPLAFLDLGHPRPFEMLYGGQLGPDRLALAWALHALHPLEPALAIALGTCLTVNAWEPEGFVGGVISPGLHMRLQAMHTFTQALPEVPLPLGLPPMDAYSSTAEAMQAGSYWGLRWEVDGWISAWHTQFPESHVYLTGGDATALVTTRKNGIFAAPKLTFVGLWAWSNEGN
jgi:type III pantothenate kinase